MYVFIKQLQSDLKYNRSRSMLLHIFCLKKQADSIRLYLLCINYTNGKRYSVYAVKWHLKCTSQKAVTECKSSNLQKNPPETSNYWNTLSGLWIMKTTVRILCSWIKAFSATWCKTSSAYKHRSMNHESGKKGYWKEIATNQWGLKIVPKEHKENMQCKIKMQTCKLPKPVSMTL